MLKRGLTWASVLLPAVALPLSLTPVRDRAVPVVRVSDPFTKSIDEAELRDHVTYLAQPALRGRRVLSAGSDAARRYVAERFTAYGLVPWQSEERYEQPFPLGVNLVGVLPAAMQFYATNTWSYALISITSAKEDSAPATMPQAELGFSHRVLFDS